MTLFSKKESTTEHTLDISKKAEHPLTEIVRFSLIAILIVIPIRMFVAQPFIVSGASMDETFQSGQYLIVDQLSYYFDQPKRGEVIVFRYPRDPSKFFIKRIIGIPGDTINIQGTVITITNQTHPDGIVLKESYIKSMSSGANLTENLGEGEYFVMGDNRDQSSDSRTWGVLEKDYVVGRAFLRLFPPGQLNYFPGSAVAEESVVDTI